MNSDAIEATLSRLRSLAGPQGVQVHPEFGWFGFLDAGAAWVQASSSLPCATPSTVISDQSSPAFTSPAKERPSRQLYRHPNYGRDLSPGLDSHQAAYYSDHSQERRRSLDLLRLRRQVRNYKRRYGKQEVRAWIKTALGTLA